MTIANGYYTLVNASGHRTFRVSSNPDFANGAQVIAMLTGADNESDYTNIGFVKDTGVAIWGKMKDWASKHPNTVTHMNRLVTGQIPMEKAGKAYALVSGKCWVCNRKLTTPESIQAGIGPVCAGKIAA